MYAIEYFLFDFSEVVCCKLVNFNNNTVLFLLKINSRFQKKFLFYFHSKISFSPKLLFPCLRKNLVGHWKGFFNHKHNRRKYIKNISEYIILYYLIINLWTNLCLKLYLPVFMFWLEIYLISQFFLVFTGGSVHSWGRLFRNKEPTLPNWSSANGGFVLKLLL